MQASGSRIPDIPAGTVRAGQAVIGEDSPFRALADALGDLAICCTSNLLAGAWVSDTFSFLTCSLLTLFQFKDALTDAEAAHALHARVDWKYALHLPLSHTGIQPATLCLFRQRIKSEPAAGQAFQAIAHSVMNLRIWPHMDEEFSLVELPLVRLCTVNQIDWKTEVMTQAIESLATFSPAWLRQYALPQWYSRYSASRVATLKHLQNEALFALAEATDADVIYLVKMLQGEDAANLAPLAEVRQLKRIWQQLGRSSSVQSNQWATCRQCLVGTCIASECRQYGCSIRH